MTSNDEIEEEDDWIDTDSEISPADLSADVQNLATPNVPVVAVGPEAAALCAPKKQTSKRTRETFEEMMEKEGAYQVWIKGEAAKRTRLEEIKEDWKIKNGTGLGPTLTSLYTHDATPNPKDRPPKGSGLKMDPLFAEQRVARSKLSIYDQFQWDWKAEKKKKSRQGDPYKRPQPPWPPSSFQDPTAREWVEYYESIWPIRCSRPNPVKPPEYDSTDVFPDDHVVPTGDYIRRLVPRQPLKRQTARRVHVPALADTAARSTCPPAPPTAGPSRLPAGVDATTTVHGGALSVLRARVDEPVTQQTETRSGNATASGSVTAHASGPSTTIRTGAQRRAAFKVSLQELAGLREEEGTIFTPTDMTAFMELLVNARHIDSSDDNAVLDAVIRLQRRPTYPTEDEGVARGDWKEGWGLGLKEEKGLYVLGYSIKVAIGNLVDNNQA